MELKQGRALMALYAVDVFIDGYKAKLPKTSSSGAREQFAHGLAELALHLRTQEASGLMAKQLTRTRKSKRTALMRDFMAPIARMAKLESARIPELKTLKMPRGEPGVEKLLGHAAGMLAVVSQHADVFVALGMRPTVVEDMQEAIDAVILTITDRTSQLGQRSGATKGLKHMLAALNNKKGVLDSLVRSDLRNAPALLAHWQLIKRAEPLPGRRRKGAAVSSLQAPRVKQLAAGSKPIRDPRRLLTPPVSDGATSGAASRP